MFTFTKKLSGATEIEKYWADYIQASMDSKSNMSASKASENFMKLFEKSKKAGLRIAAARLRKDVIAVYKENAFNWPQHSMYSNWFGNQSSVAVAHVVRANRPRLGAGRAIQQPKSYPIGGKLPKATRYATTEDNFEVGILKTARQVDKNKMEKFQAGGQVATRNSESARKYLAALGIYVRRSTIMNIRPRPLFDPLLSKKSPAKMFESAFEDVLRGKLQIEER